ncbi:MAG: hypothetical protein ABIK65_04060 [Candidatus Eisenbacteria bacterium]
MEVLLGILAYFALALFTGRFLSLSTRGAVAYPAASNGAEPRLYSPAETANLSVADRPRERERTKEPEREKTLV